MKIKLKYKLHRVIESLGWTFWGGAIASLIIGAKINSQEFKSIGFGFGGVSLLLSAVAIILGMYYKDRKKKRRARSLHEKIQCKLNKLNDKEGYNLQVQTPDSGKLHYGPL